MRWAGHVARIEERTGAYAWGNLRERGHLEDLGVYGIVILKCILKKWVGRV
jgi:hypothetical protein